MITLCHFENGAKRAGITLNLTAQLWLLGGAVAGLFMT